MKKSNPISLAQQQEKALAEKFIEEYKALVEKYGFDFSSQIQIIKVQPNVNPNSNLNPLGVPDKPTK